jgi:hypothetical protein
LILALAYYLWTAGTSSPFSFSDSNNDIYNLLTRALLHGHTYLPLKVPAALLALKDPYDPAQNAPYASPYHDLALYHARFYSLWGPSPTLLFALFRLTTFKMSQSFAVAIYSFVGLACAVGLLHLLVRRLLPRTPDWLLTMATVALVFGNTAPFLLRRPAQYEVEISGGYCFMMAGLLLVISAVTAATVRRRRLAVGSLLLGLAVAARPSLIVGGVVALVVGVYAVRRGKATYRILVPALVPLVVCGLLLAAYNVERFGSPVQFGVPYQLASISTLHKPTGDPAYIPPGVFSYLLVPPRVAVTFPHFFLMDETRLNYPWRFPAGYAGADPTVPVEPAGGLFPTIPITLILLAIPFLWWKRPGDHRFALFVASGLALCAVTVIVLLALALWGTTERYEVDFATLALIPSFMVWSILISSDRGRGLWRRTVVIAGIALTVLTALEGIAFGFVGYYDSLRVNDPGAWSTLEDITSPLATLPTVVGGQPAIARVSAATVPVVFPPTDYGTVTESGASSWLGNVPLTVTIDSPGSRSLGLGAVVGAVPGQPTPASLIITVTSPGRRPTTVHIIGRSFRLPIHLHLGLNRVRLGLTGKPTSAQELLLANIRLIS